MNVGDDEGYGLATAIILYRMPDYHFLLQTYIWQEHDICPEFPRLHSFLKFWMTSLDGPLHSVTVAHSRLVRPTEIRTVDGIFSLH